MGPGLSFEATTVACPRSWKAAGTWAALVVHPYTSTILCPTCNHGGKHTKHEHSRQTSLQFLGYQRPKPLFRAQVRLKPGANPDHEVKEDLVPGSSASANLLKWRGPCFQWKWTGLSRGQSSQTLALAPSIGKSAVPTFPIAVLLRRRRVHVGPPSTFSHPTRAPPAIRRAGRLVG